MKILLTTSILLATSILFISCDKHRAKKLSGTYYCKVDYNFNDYSETNYDSTYYKELEVLQDGKFIKIKNMSFHIDSLWKEKEIYKDNHSKKVHLQFKNDSIYYTIIAGGLGAAYTYSYTGIKMKE
jgi:hypothetical protein